MSKKAIGYISSQFPKEIDVLLTCSLNVIDEDTFINSDISKIDYDEKFNIVRIVVKNVDALHTLDKMNIVEFYEDVEQQRLKFI